MGGGGSSAEHGGGHAVGTTGWQAPEVLALRQRLWDSDQRAGQASPMPTNDDGGDDRALLPSGDASPAGRDEAMAADLWSCGCVFFHVLTRGGHPFGDKWFEREANVAQGRAVGGRLVVGGWVVVWVGRVVKTDGTVVRG